MTMWMNSHLSQCQQQRVSSVWWMVHCGMVLLHVWAVQCGCPVARKVRGQPWIRNVVSVACLRQLVCTIHNCDITWQRLSRWFPNTAMFVSSCLEDSIQKCEKHHSKLHTILWTRLKWIVCVTVSGSNMKSHSRTDKYTVRNGLYGSIHTYMQLKCIGLNYQTRSLWEEKAELK